MLEQAISTKVLQIQPVEPPKRSSEEIGQLAAAGAVGIPALTALFGLFVWLASGAVHELFPLVPAASYWQSVWLVLGWHTVCVIARPRSWKWARR